MTLGPLLAIKLSLINAHAFLPPPSVFHFGGWNKRHFVEGVSVLQSSLFIIKIFNVKIFNVFNVNVTFIQNKCNIKIFVQKSRKQNYIPKILVSKKIKIPLDFILSEKNKKEMHDEQTTQTAYIFYGNRFLFVLQKTHRNLFLLKQVYFYKT